MASPHDRNTLPEGDRPAEKPEGSSNDAAQEQAADTSKTMQPKKPILDVSTVVTRNTLEEFVELIFGLEQPSLDSLSENDNAQSDDHTDGIYPDHDVMTWAGLFANSLLHRRDPVMYPLSFAWELHQAGIPTYMFPRAWNGGDRIPYTKDIEEVTICVLAKVAPLLRKLEIAKLEEAD
ncbi:hypothetical protein NCS52_01103300 [Fusarium sp. LHS14.1]|nr:hypothetical protein NCS52_01103300 [Fusarium sp. LHS14.1]